MMKLVKVFVEPRVVKDSVTPVCDIVLPNENQRCLYQKPKVSMFCVIKIDTGPSPIHNPTGHRR
jgi:hypothetical protein